MSEDDELWPVEPSQVVADALADPRLPVDQFARRAERLVAHPIGVSYARARDALRTPGTILDVGAGAGAASLPLSGRITGLVAVDVSADMLDALRGRAAVPTETVLGRWPDVSDRTPVADVVVCHHVFYNVPGLVEFARALTRHARRRVVVELTRLHPMSALNPLWTHFHGIERPTGPTAEDAIAVLREAGLHPREERWRRPAEPDNFPVLVETTRRRLCLPPERRDEVADVLRTSPIDRTADLLTLWWEP